MDTLLQKLEPFIPRIRERKETLLLLIAGLLTIACIDILSTQKLQREREYQQRLMAQQVQAKLQSIVEEHVTALIALNVVYQNFVDINHYDFQQYGQSITGNLKGFRRLMYLDPGAAIRRIYPLNPANAAVLGLKVNKTSQFETLFNQAKYLDKPATSNLTNFLGHPGSIVAVMPIYRNHQDFLGYAAGEISVKDIWDSIRQTDILAKYEMQLQDPGGNFLIARVQLKKNDRILTQVPFRIAGKQWILYLQPIHPTLEGLLAQRFLIWALGLLILFLIHMLIAGSKRYKEHLSEAQRQFETIFQASPDGIITLDHKLQIQLANPPVQEWSGLDRYSLEKKTFFDLFTCQCPHLNKCKELKFLLCTSDQFEESLPEILETEITSSEDGVLRTMRLNASRMQQGKGESGFICVLGDISTKKELERVTESYIATLTHDLKTPLLAQEMVLETILTGGTGEITQDQHKLLSGASDSIHDLLEMVNSTLLYYKLESSHMTLNKQVTAVDELIKEVIDTQKPLVEKRHLGVQLETSVDLPHAWVDPIQLKRVIQNLLSNAISYARRNSTIRIRLSSESAERLTIEIANEGKGIRAEDLPKIFDRYYSLSRKFKQIGTGLGLYISRRIVELHGGKIWAESEPNKETRFFISLPVPTVV